MRDDGLNFARGFFTAIPLACLLWLALAMAFTF